jgi:arginine deiminase
MKTLKQNFTVPEDVVKMLKAYIGKRKRSAFVTDAVRVRLKQLEERQLQQELIEGYKARKEESREINREWEQVTLEKLE